VNILRRLPLSRLLLLCGLVVAIGVSATALALAVDSGPVPESKPLAQAIHDALAGPSVEGVSASVTLTDHLLEGASLSGAGGLASSPLIAGASGRLWVAKDGRVRLELQASGGDTQILYDGTTVSIYDASTNTLYRYTPSPAKAQGAYSTSQNDGATQTTLTFKPDTTGRPHEAPSVAKIEEAIAHLERHDTVSGAQPTDVAGQPAYTVRVAPKEGGSLLGGAELSFDAVHGLPLRAAVYSSTSASPVIELAATEVSYGPVESSVFSFSPPADATVKEIGG
jgi:outer membrane lipoprotein-sorting protein